jgi:hypothetical protein
MATRDRDDATMNATLARTWSRVRFTAGMAILSAVFVISHGLLLVHELTRGEVDAQHVA